MISVIDREAAPAIQRIERIQLPPVKQQLLSNGIPFHIVPGGTQEVVKLELIFPGGRWQEDKKGVAQATAKMLTEGTRSRSSQQIAETIEFYGASISGDAAVDHSSVSLFCIKKHFPGLISLLAEIITEPSFPQQEFDLHINNNKQWLLVNLEKVDFLAHMLFNEKMYGLKNPLGYPVMSDDLDQLATNDLISFHHKNYSFCNYIIASGMIDHEEEALIEKHFGSNPSNHHDRNHVDYATNRETGDFFTLKKDAVQSGVRLGCPVAGRLHEDYIGLRVLNTALGGYFGSRLMQNLREDKGYCYGIHSNLSMSLHHAHLQITTEVASEVTHSALSEIFSEIHRLQEKAIPEEELELVKNYMLGSLLADTDGPFAVADIWRGLMHYELPPDDFEKRTIAIRTMDSETLLNLARKYLKHEDFTIAVSGKSSPFNS
jgi:predicted Zn-dependent peptidase